MALTYVFKNVIKKAVNGTYDAPINPTLGYSVDNEATLGFAEDFGGEVKGDVKIPVYDHGFHGYAVVHPGESFTVTLGEDASAAEVAFYTDLACKFKNAKLKGCIEVDEIPADAEPSHAIYSI